MNVCGIRISGQQGDKAQDLQIFLTQDAKWL